MTIEEINEKIKNAPNLNGTSGNERLVLSGLLEEFDYCKVNDKAKARFILERLGFDLESVNQILNL